MRLLLGNIDFGTVTGMASANNAGAITVGIDIGTSSVKAVAADDDGNVIRRARVPHAFNIPTPDRFEHDAHSFPADEPPDAHDQANPYRSNANAWRESADHFDDHCATCHGADGRGHTEIGGYMYPPVPDLADPAIQQMSDGDLFYIIQNGVRWTGMPGWRKEHTPEDTWKLVSFVRRVPSLTAEDLESFGHDKHEGEKEQHHERQ